MQGVDMDQHHRQLPMASPLPCTTATSSVATLPAKKKGKGKLKPNDDLPWDAPPLSANVDTWAQFMHQWQLGLTQVTDDRAWHQVFPGALWRGPIDGHNEDPLPPFTRAVCGFLLIQRLMPQSQFNMG